MVSPWPMETHLSHLWVFATFQNFAQNSVDSWMETSEMTSEPLIPSSLCLTFTLSPTSSVQTPPFDLLPPHPRPSPLFSHSVSFMSLTSPLLRSATVTEKLAAVSNLFQPLFLISSDLSLSLGSNCQQTQFPALALTWGKFAYFSSQPWLCAPLILSPFWFCFHLLPLL